MISTTVYLTIEQDRELRELCERTHVPAAHYIRQGVDKVLEWERAREQTISDALTSDGNGAGDDPEA